MRLPTIRIVDLLEWIVALALGLATYRACFALPIWRLQWAQADNAWTRMTFVIAPILFGVAIFEGLALAVERARGRGPRPWGVGRWTWSIAAIYVVLKAAFDLVSLVLLTVRATGAMPTRDTLARYFIYYLLLTFGAHFACALAAFIVTAQLAGLPAAPSLDGREWSGRVFAAFVVGWAMVTAIDIVLIWG